MDRIELSSVRRLKGEFSPPPDKSISHRAIILSSLASGQSLLRNVLRAKDIDSTINAFRALGIDISGDHDSLVVHGKGLHGLSEPSHVIDCGNSGTTMRLISGVLAGHPFFSVLSGDNSLRNRPMARIITPLALMGADIRGRDGNKYPPLAIAGSRLLSVNYTMPVSSAQVKSAILLAGLFTHGETVVTEPVSSRDHTEKMLFGMGAAVKISGRSVSIQGGSELPPLEITVPGDFSSAAFFVVASLLVPDADITLRNVGINPTRTGLLDILGQMGADIGVTDISDVAGEPVADLHCRSTGRLKAVVIKEDSIPSLIDEFPILCVAAASAEGTTSIRGAEELRVKESDRISAMATELRKLGIPVKEYDDGLDITGCERFSGALVDSHDDHRIAMSMAVASLIASGTTIITGASSVDISFPGFFDMIRKCSA